MYMYIINMCVYNTCNLKINDYINRMVFLPDLLLRNTLLFLCFFFKVWESGVDIVK
jgi:hypothetical protein